MKKTVISIADLQVDESVFGLSRGKRCELGTCKGGCCRNGVWVDSAHRDRVLARAAEIQPHLPAVRRNPADWFDDERMDHPDFPTGVGLPTAVFPDPEDSTLDTCVFRRPDALCALQVADPELKPFDCYTYPILRSEGELTLDKWSPDELDGSDCQQACTPPQPILDVFEDEFVRILGRENYLRLKAAAAGRETDGETDGEGTGG